MAMFLRRGDDTMLPGRQNESAMPLRQAIDRLFQESFLMPSAFEGGGSWSTNTGTNLWQSGEGYVLQMALPGMRPDSITCTVEKSTLTVTAEPALQAPENATAVWQTFGGPVQYRIQLPHEVETGQSEASYDAGVLTLRLPKPVQARAHTIKVQAR